MTASQLERVLTICAQADRVCPRPWHEFWELLERHRPEGTAPPPKPLILGAWWHTSSLDKRVRLRQQVEWAQRAGCLDEAEGFLGRLIEDDWYYLGDSDLA